MKGFDDYCGIFKKIKNFWQRGTRGYSDYDLGDFDQYLSTIITKGLLKFTKLDYGVPTEFCKKGSVDEGKEKWDATIYEIIKGFSISEEKSYLEMSDSEKKQFDKSFKLFKKYFSNFWI